MTQNNNEPAIARHWQDDPEKRAIRLLVRTIAHEWLKDAAPTTDNQERILKFLDAALTNFHLAREQRIVDLERELLDLHKVTIRVRPVDKKE